MRSRKMDREMENTQYAQRVKDCTKKKGQEKIQIKEKDNRKKESRKEATRSIQKYPRHSGVF